jgi:hypothetical protein
MLETTWLGFDQRGNSPGLILGEVRALAGSHTRKVTQAPLRS